MPQSALAQQLLQILRIQQTQGHILELFDRPGEPLLGPRRHCAETLLSKRAEIANSPSCRPSRAPSPFSYSRPRTLISRMSMIMGIFFVSSSTAASSPRKPAKANSGPSPCSALWFQTGDLRDDLMDRAGSIAQARQDRDYINSHLVASNLLLFHASRRATASVTSARNTGKLAAVKFESRGRRQLRPPHQWCHRARMQAWFWASRSYQW